MNRISYINYIIFSLFLLFNFSAGKGTVTSYPDIKIIKSDRNYMIIEWQPQNFKLYTSQKGDIDFQKVSFDYAAFYSSPGQPNIPWRTLVIGVPESANSSVQILEKQSKSYQSVLLEPVPHLRKNKHGISETDYKIDQSIYSENSYFPKSIINITEPSLLRDMKIQKISISPVQFNPASKSMTFYTKLRIKITYNQTKTVKKRFVKHGKLDDIYEQLLLNFDQSKHWQVDDKFTLKKAASLPGGTWRRMTVTEDGLYKISASTLQNAGVDLSGLSVNSIQMFNNGGHTLSVITDAASYNPPFTTEIPIFIEDKNQNDLFDGSDCIFFYGKNVNGWFYNSSKNDFVFHQHAYAVKNYYWLTVSGTNGLRMEKNLLSEQPGAVETTFYYDRFHFEEDKYNLLASGPDWYGQLFYGKSDGHSQNFTITTNKAPLANPRFRMQLKGGTGMKSYDKIDYSYYFTISLNNNQLYTNEYLYKGNRVLLEKTISNELINNGVNTLSIQYSANNDGCRAHLDWFELYYPRSFDVNANYLDFYTNDINKEIRYRLNGFSDVDDIYIFDVSDPVNPQILKENATSQSGQIIFDIEALANRQNILVSSLSSSKIKNVSSLQSYIPGQDLLNSSNQADFLIITHKTFTPYAQQIADLRSHLTSKVITTEEIYFSFNNGVPDPAAIRNFIRYAYYNWQDDKPSYVLLFGDGHYDYRNIIISDTMRVPPFEIYNSGEVDSRTTDNFFVDLNYSSGGYEPDLAVGRLPVESTIDAERIVEKLIDYENNPIQDGWQTVITFVADDERNNDDPDDVEWKHQSQAEKLASMSQLAKFNIKKVYLSAYPSKPGGIERLKPEANSDIIDYINQGTLIINYVGHGSPTGWTRESVFNMNRDLSRISNEKKLPFMIAATCSFGKYDDPHEPCFPEALIWKKHSGIIGAMTAVRPSYPDPNFSLNKSFYQRLFPGGGPSECLGNAYYLAANSSVNDQKYHLFADPTMKLADPRQQVQITSITPPDTLKALSKVEVKGRIMVDGQFSPDFNGGAVLIANDARYDSVTTGGGLYYTLSGPVIFKGELTVSGGLITGQFIVPRSIRYYKKPTGRLTLYAWNDQNNITALGYNNSLLLNGSTNIVDTEGPEIDIYFKDQENFSSGDFIPQNSTLIAAISDDNGINITGEAGHNILLQIDDDTPKNISGFFFYEKNSFTNGYINYPVDAIKSGAHTLKLSVFDNLNNPAEHECTFKITGSSELLLADVVNYPNPFSQSTRFTFQTNQTNQTNRDNVEVTIKIYTINGRLIQQLEGSAANAGYNEIPWDGLDKDGDELANGVYLYKIILKDNEDKKEVIEKLVILK